MSRKRAAGFRKAPLSRPAPTPAWCSPSPARRSAPITARSAGSRWRSRDHSVAARSLRSARNRGKLGAEVLEGLLQAARRAQALAAAQHGELGLAWRRTGADRFDDRIG